MLFERDVSLSKSEEISLQFLTPQCIFGGGFGKLTVMLFERDDSLERRSGHPLRNVVVFGFLQQQVAVLLQRSEDCAL